MAKVALIISAILTLLLPFSWDGTIQFQMTASDLILTISVFILTYILLACAWAVAQVVVTLVFVLVADVAKVLWRVLKTFIVWIVE